VQRYCRIQQALQRRLVKLSSVYGKASATLVAQHSSSLNHLEPSVSVTYIFNTATAHLLQDLTACHSQTLETLWQRWQLLQAAAAA
jgi:hypothetical protein